MANSGVAQDTRPTGKSVLDILDNREIGGLYVYLAVLATIGGFLFGFDSSNIGSAMVFLPFHLGSIGTGITVAGASLGSAVGALAAGPLTDKHGRKSLLLIDSALFALGSLVSAFAPEPITLIVGRIIIGIAIGADSAIATAYIAEFAPKSRRGGLSIIQQWMITIGILCAYVVAVVILKSMPGSATTLDWRIMLGVGFLPAFISLIMRAKMPESPRWLLEHGRVDDVVTAMKKLDIEVSKDDVQRESDQLQAQKERNEKSAWTPAVKRAFIVVSVFFVFQQITGINVAFYYGPELLQPYFGTSDKVTSAVSGVLAAGILAIVNVIATYFAFKLIDKTGRRKLAITAYLLMIVFLVAGAICTWTLSGTPKMIAVMLTFSLFICCFAIGIGGTGWLIQGEVFPTSVRGRAAAGAAGVDWIANYALVVAFPAMQAGLGLAWVMIIFAVLCAAGAGFVYKFLPETKNKSAEEIIRLFEGPVNLKDPGEPAVR